MRRMTCSDLKKFFSNWRSGLVVLAVLGCSVWALWCVPSRLVEHVQGTPLEIAKLKDEHRRTLAQILGGVGLLYGLYLGWRRVRAAEEGQITERFTKAIEQLGQEGDDKMAIRLGGIYALERIAKDSEKDHGPIMEVLTAYVRQRAPAPGEDPEEDPEKNPEEDLRLPATDIQAILTVIGRRETTDDNRRNNPLDLTHTQLYGANLRGANLGGVRLYFAELHGADLCGADLRGTDLTRADLLRADLTRVKNLTEEQVQEAKIFRQAFLPDYLAHLMDEPPF